MSDPIKDKRLPLPLVKAPDSIWTSIEAALDSGKESQPISRHPIFRPWVWAASLSAAAAVVICLLPWHRVTAPKAGWAVVRLYGNPSVGSKPIGDAGRIAEGEWLQTDSSSRARITVGDIGTVEVAPNTRVQVLALQPQEHRLKLLRGEISASVSAPPRLFFVDTPASTAVDLGCAYTIQADSDGNGLLQVTLGWVSLEWEGRESLVPAGASCRTRPHIGPGTPYFNDASERFVDALAEFDFRGGGESAVDTVLGEARVRDTLTLWHLLSRIEPAERPRVYDRIAALVAVPDGVLRERTLELDPATLKLLREELAWKW